MVLELRILSLNTYETPIKGFSVMLQAELDESGWENNTPDRKTRSVRIGYLENLMRY